ncbi:MAG: hypothetical protein MST10_01560 [Lentisphaeria bacterium]|nr:hypothetical protein [Lentisphaeria bacterium]
MKTAPEKVWAANGCSMNRLCVAVCGAGCSARQAWCSGSSFCGFIGGVDWWKLKNIKKKCTLDWLKFAKLNILC